MILKEITMGPVKLKIAEHNGEYYLHPVDVWRYLCLEEVDEQVIDTQKYIYKGESRTITGVPVDKLEDLLAKSKVDDYLKNIFRGVVADLVDGVRSRLVKVGAKESYLRFSEDDCRCCYNSLKAYLGLDDDQMTRGAEWVPFGRDMTCSVDDMTTLCVMADKFPLTEEDVGMINGTWDDTQNLTGKVISGELASQLFNEMSQDPDVDKTTAVFAKSLSVLFEKLLINEKMLKELEEKIKILEDKWKIVEVRC